MTRLYSAIPADRRSELPPSLPIWSGRCSRCAKQVIAHAPSLRKRQREALQGGAIVEVVCPGCADKALQQHGGIEVMQFTREVGKHFLRG